VNPIAAAVVGWVALNEPVGISLALGLVLVFAGIWVATWNDPKDQTYL
jgi:drug/metabolite transporter (DMT)-like permease